MAGVAALSAAQGGALVSFGSDNVYVVATGAGVTLRPGVTFSFRANRDSTSAPFLNVDGTGPQPWLDAMGGSLPATSVSGGLLYTVAWRDAEGGRSAGWRTVNGVSETLPAIGDRLSRLLNGKARERVSLLDFIDPSLHAAIAAGTIASTVDLSAAMANAAAYVKAGLGRLVIPSGVYPYSVSPNWAAPHARIVCEGEVRFRYTGVGVAFIADSGPITGSGASLVVPPGTYDMAVGSRESPLIIEAPATASHGAFLRAIHHSRFAFNVRGCGPTSAALYGEFGVCTEIDIKCSVNQGGWYQDARPGYGFIFDKQNGDPADYRAASFLKIRPIVEGVPVGGVMRTTLGCTISGGTIENCSQYGLDIQVGSDLCKVVETDFEVNGTAGAGFDVRDNGRNSHLVNIQTLGRGLDGVPTSGVVVGATSNGLQVDRGTINQIFAVVGAANATLDRVRYNSFGDGALIDNAGCFLIRAAYNVTTNKTHDALPSRTVVTGLPGSATAGAPYLYKNTSRNVQTVGLLGGTGLAVTFVPKGGVGDGPYIANLFKLLPDEGLALAYTAPPTVVVYT